MQDFHPILTCEESLVFEREHFLTDEDKIWEAMCSVGRSLGQMILRDYSEIGTFSKEARILILCGCGHNTGDAFLGVAKILDSFPEAEVSILPIFGEKELSRLTQRAFDGLKKKTTVKILQRLETGISYDVCLDGIFGMSLRLPLPENVESVLKDVNTHISIRLRAAVDLPSGFGDEKSDLCFRADFTYATGIAKFPLFKKGAEANVGRIRYIDLGFFDSPYTGAHSTREYILCSSVLNDLKVLRKSDTHKYDYGHLLIMCGSRQYPGALIMAVKAALKSGLGLVTVCAPESLIAEFSLAIPEAIWVTWPENSEGGLAYEGKALLEKVLPRVHALLLGPGMGDSEDTQLLISDIVREVSLPIVVDANALTQATIGSLAERPLTYPSIILTPHQGEFMRIAGEEVDLKKWSRSNPYITLLKGSVSKIASDGIIYNSPFGGPILARGGSGDILGGIIAAILAKQPNSPLSAVFQGVVWHGMAADYLARKRGVLAVQTTDFLDVLGDVLR